jgi:hypothetical protein
MVLDEVKEIITLPSEPAKYLVDPDNVELVGLKVTTHLRDYVATVASLCPENHFHSFNHASHVSMSVTKLMARIVTPDTIDYTDMTYKAKAASAKLHGEYTFGITSDPLTQFAVAFSALIHDVDHPGVPNSQLVKEGTDVARTYRNLSVAEQNSVDLAWGLLIKPGYKTLRRYIYVTRAEQDRISTFPLITLLLERILLSRRDPKNDLKAIYISQSLSDPATKSPGPSLGKKWRCFGTDEFLLDFRDESAFN